MIDWNNFDMSKRDDDEEENRTFTRTEVIDWDNFGRNNNVVNTVYKYITITELQIAFLF